VINDGRKIDEAAGALKGIACANSFIGTTPVLMADGSSKPIDQVKVGDQITNAEPGAPPGTPDQKHTVTAVHVTYTDHDYTDVTVQTDHGPATIVGTAHHLYWDATTHTWTEAEHLHTGDQLQTSGGALARITGLRSHTASIITFNLTIDSLHTYYVEAGNTPVLVHNSNCLISSVIGSNGEHLPLPAGASGTPVSTGKGFTYDIPSGTEGLDPRVVKVRVMNPVTTGKYQYPNGYVVYENKAGQSVNPLTGQTVSNADPYNHIPIP
jgi:hypothetical protein